MTHGPIPFLRPNLVPKEAYLPYLAEIDASHLYSNFGPLNQRFESGVIARMFGGAGSVTTVNNATIGLMLAMRQVRRPGGRYAVMPSFTFAATPLAAEWAGLEPYFVDADPVTWCMSEAGLREALTELGDQVAVVVPYATFGTAMDLAPYEDLHRSGTPVVVDAAASFGASREGETFGQGFPGLVVFSFHATKAFGVGEGGLIYGADADLMLRIRRAGNFGFGPARQSEDCGLNSKISEYTAAIALATLDAYPAKVAHRLQIHGWYADALKRAGAPGKGWEEQGAEGKIPYQFMPLLCPPDQGNDAVVARLAATGIEARTYFSPACHQQPQFASSPCGGLGVTEGLSRRILSLPLWEGMDQDVVARVVKALIP